MRGDQRTHPITLTNLKRFAMTTLAETLVRVRLVRKYALYFDSIITHDKTFAIANF